MDNGKLRIDNIFNSRTFFEIPNYQRSYAWEEKQLKDFFDDYMNHYNSQNYYYGTILLQLIKKDRKNNSKEFFDIVDGQQRFTTLIIFISCLIKKLSPMGNEDVNTLHKQFVKNGELYILKLQNDDDNDFFSTVILDGDDTEDVKTPAQKRLLYAKKFFEAKLSDCSKEQVEALLDKIYSTNVLIYLIHDSIEAAMIFETTNDRGKSLTNLEKTKSFLMYKASLCLKEPEHVLEIVKSRFSTIYNDFESMTALNINIEENSVLQYNYIAYEKWKTDNNTKEYQRYMESFKNQVELLTKTKNDESDDENADLSEYIYRYTKNIKESFAAYKNIYEGNYPEFMDIIALDRSASFMPLLIKCFRSDNSSDKKNFRIICRLCQIFSFRVFVIFDKMANKMQSRWYTLARDFEGDFNHIASEIVQMIKSVESDKAFINALSAPDFCTKYSGLEKNYFYWKYENYLRETKQPIATPMTHNDLLQKDNKKLVMTIEHIIARSNTDEKSKVIADALKIDVGSVEEFDEQYLNSIGNLTLDPHSANSSKGKKNVEDKNSKYFAKAPYKCQNELEDFMVNGIWTLDSIKKRKKEILEFAKKQWCNFDFIKELT